MRLALKARKRTPAPPFGIADKIFFLTSTANHHHAVRGIIHELGERAARSDTALLTWMSTRAALYCLPFLPILLFRGMVATRYRRSTLWAYFDQYWVSYGQLLAASRLLRERPSMIVLSNDHRPLHRAVALAARLRRIPTAFVPHAGVVEGFPALDFDYAFLDGLQGARAYARMGASRSLVFLSGIARLDSVLKGPARGVQDILICPGLDDDPEPVIRLVSRCAEFGDPQRITLRPHPRDVNGRRYREAADSIRCAFSDATQVPAENALADAGVVVCGNSNIMLEAKLTRRRVAMFVASGPVTDSYGYVDEGIPDTIVRDWEGLASFLSAIARVDSLNSPPLAQRMATLGTPWEGRSAELISMTMRDLVDGETNLESRWIPVHGEGFGAVYRPDGAVRS